ncbi:MAG: FtsX-like permease family protein [Lachnospiraceae bacterium]|nr:FtsX-like permease family protein [Lachnospiraceae bacterium]
MFHLVLQRILHKKWMVASLLIGNILLIAIAVSHPMYQDAARRRMLTDLFANSVEKSNDYPMTIRTTGLVRKRAGLESTRKITEFSDTLPEKFGLAKVADVCFRRMTLNGAVSINVHKGIVDEQRISIASIKDIGSHARMLSGELPSGQMTDDGFMEAMISQSAMVTLNLVVGEELEFTKLKRSDGENVKIRISGIFSYEDADDPFWVDGPDTYEDCVLIDDGLFSEQFAYQGADKYQYDVKRIILLDYTQLRPENVARILQISKDMAGEYKSVYSSIEEPAYIPLLEQFEGEEKRIDATLSILQVPVIVLLCAFIFMISQQMLEMEDNEIALLKSRGASRRQIVRMYFYQSLVLSGVSFVTGLPFGALICKILGASSAFLQFDSPRSLTVEFTGQVLEYAAIAVVVSMLMTLLPVFKKDRSSIVAVKRKKSRSSKPLWQKLYLDFIMLGVSLYGLYSFSSRQDELLVRVMSGQSLDPLLFLSSSLFILGAGLISLRLHRLIVKLIYTAGKKYWQPAGYASFLQLIRTGDKQAFIMVFLVLTVALGLFNTTVARTILANAENNIEYVSGADIVMQEYWKNNAAFVSVEREEELVYTEPDFGKYGQLDCQGAAKVFTDDAVSVKLDKETIDTSLMAIETRSFGETAKMKDGLLKYDYYDYLNVLSKNPDAVLMSSNFRDKYGLKLGDKITYDINDGPIQGKITATVYGFVDFWPSYRPTGVIIREDNSTSIVDNFLIVAHLSTVQEKVGVFPYKVWLNMGGNTDAYYDFVDYNKVPVTDYTDTAHEKEEIAAQPLFQGTNGILTMSFITIVLVCAIGYVIYWMLSIRSRELLFGIFRAMGMSRGEVIRMLVNEQVFTGLFGIAFGLGIGWLASYLFVPIIQIAYSAADRVLPLELITKGSDIARLVIIVMLMFAVCLAILIHQVFRMKISQALKLGED